MNVRAESPTREKPQTRGLRREQTLHSHHRTITSQVVIEENQSKKETVVAQQLVQIVVTSQKEDF